MSYLSSRKREDEIFLLRHRIKEQRPDSFAEQQAQYGRDTAERLNSLGEDLFQVLQGNIITFNALCLHANALTLSQHNPCMVLLVSLAVSTTPLTLVCFMFLIISRICQMG
jgi:hypothetical protein